MVQPIIYKNTTSMKDKKTKHNISKHPLYNVYNNMINRCYDTNNKSYNDYGARGVVVCDEWKNSIDNFYNWAIKNNWELGLHLDKDIKGNGFLYSPNTCTFVTPKVNSNKRIFGFYPSNYSVLNFILLLF